MNTRGPEFFQENDPKRNWIPINPLNIFSKALNMSRTQFPIRLAYAFKNSSLLEGRVKEENRLNDIAKKTLSKYHSLFN